MNGEKNSCHQTFSQQYHKRLSIPVKEFSAATADIFLHQLEQRIELIAKHPTIGKPSAKKKNIRSIIFSPHNRIFYRYHEHTIEILCLFDMRKDPTKTPY